MADSSCTNLGDLTSWLVLIILCAWCTEHVSSNYCPNISTVCTDDQSNVLHCLEDGKPFQIPDPFPADVALSSDMFYMNWCYTHELDIHSTLHADVYESSRAGVRYKRVLNPRISQYQFCGIEIKNVTVNDSGTYIAYGFFLDLNHKSYRAHYKIFNVDMAVLPKLKSQNLTVVKRENHKHARVYLVCGTVEDLGQPPAQLVWKDSQGKILPSKYNNGTLTLSLSGLKGEDSGSYYCLLKNASSSAQCIPDSERVRWKAVYTFPSTNVTAIVVGVVVPVVGIGIIIAVAYLVYKQRRGLLPFNFNKMT